MKSCQNLKEEVHGMAQEEGHRAQVSESYFHPDLDLAGSKVFKRDIGGSGGGKPCSVLVDSKMAAKATIGGDQNIGEYFREGATGQEGKQDGDGTSDDTEDDDGEEEEEEEEDGEEGDAFKREQIIVEVNLNNQTLHVSKGENKMEVRLCILIILYS